MNDKDILYEKRKKMKRRYQMIFFSMAALVCCVGVLAKYLFTHTSPSGQIRSSNFYFTADLLGDTKMLPTEGETSDFYAFGEESTEGTWQLYGGSSHELQIYVQNYYDSQRIEQKEITYTVEISIKDKDGNEITLEDSQKPTVTNSGKTQEGYVMKGGTQVRDTLTLTIPSTAVWKYKTGTVVTVEIVSRKPYEKTLSLNFQMFASDATLKYRVMDTKGSPYAQLVIMTNVESGDGEASVQPYITWPKELSIDNTNKLTFTRDTDGKFIRQSGIEERNMQISETLPTGRSETIYFFKENAQENYSVGDTVVMPLNGKYTINLAEKFPG